MQQRLKAISCAAALGLSCVSFLPMSVFADDAIEPGSPESFIYWTGSTLDYVDSVLTSNNVAEWGVSTVGYALDMRSMLIAYSNYYDNQSFVDIGSLTWQSAVGWIYVFDPISQSTTQYYVHATGCRNPISGTFNLLPASSYCSAPFATFSMNSVGSLPTLSPFSGSGEWNFSLGLNSNSSRSTFCDSSDSSPFSGIAFISSTISYRKSQSYQSINCISTTPSGLSAIYFHSGMSLIDLYGTIRDKYPDADFDQFPDIVPPVNDVEFSEEPTTEPDSHPCGCQCEVHVYVDVTVDNNLGGLLEGGNTLNAGDVADLGVDPDAALNALDELSFDAVQTESMQAGIGLIWALFSEFTESTGLMPFIMVCMLVMLLLWFFGRSL